MLGWALLCVDEISKRWYPRLSSLRGGWSVKPLRRACYISVWLSSTVCMWGNVPVCPVYEKPFQSCLSLVVLVVFSDHYLPTLLVPTGLYCIDKQVRRDQHSRNKLEQCRKTLKLDSPSKSWVFSEHMKTHLQDAWGCWGCFIWKDVKWISTFQKQPPSNSDDLTQCHAL